LLVVEVELLSATIEVTLSADVIESSDDPALPTNTFFVMRPVESTAQCMAVTTMEEEIRIPEQNPVEVAE